MWRVAISILAWVVKGFDLQGRQSLKATVSFLGCELERNRWLQSSRAVPPLRTTAYRSSVWTASQTSRFSPIAGWLCPWSWGESAEMSIGPYKAVRIDAGLYPFCAAICASLLQRREVSGWFLSNDNTRLLRRMTKDPLRQFIELAISGSSRLKTSSSFLSEVNHRLTIQSSTPPKLRHILIKNRLDYYLSVFCRIMT